MADDNALRNLARAIGDDYKKAVEAHGLECSPDYDAIERILAERLRPLLAAQEKLNAALQCKAALIEPIVAREAWGCLCAEANKWRLP